jgi:CHAT domain-containing protein
MTAAERLAAINAEIGKPGAEKNSAGILDLLAEAASLVDSRQEPKKWGAYRLLYAQAAESSDADAAMRAYRDSIPVWDSAQDHNALAACHYGLGNLLFARVKTPDDVEEVIPHLEFAAADFPADSARKLSVLFSFRQAGDPFDNWKKRADYLEVAAAHISREESPAGWAAVRNDLAVAWTQEPGGNFAKSVERRIENHLGTLAGLTPDQDASVRRAFVQTCIFTAEAYEFRVQGDLSENQASALWYAQKAVETSDESVPPELRAQGLLGLGRALTNRSRFPEALEKLDRAGALVDRNAMPMLASTLDRFRAIVYANLAALGDKNRLDDMLAAARLSWQASEAAGDASAGRTVMWIAGEAFVKAGQFARAIPCLERAAEAGEKALAQATTRAGRLERIWDLHDLWALLAYCLLETGSIAEAAEALDRGKARLWRGPAHASADEMRALIPVGGALLFPVLSAARGAVIIAAENGWGIAWLENFGQEQLRSLVFGAGHPVTPENLTSLTGWVMLYATRHVNADRWKELVGNAGEQLYREVWRAVEEELGRLGVVCGAELVWFPQGVSSILPMHSAYSEKDGVRHYLTEDYAIRYAPSAAILLAAHPAARSDRTLFVANPEEDLPYTELEIEFAKQTLGAGDATILVGTGATRDAVVSRLSGLGCLHFAGHAWFQVGDPFQSSLGLAPPERLSIEDLEPLLLKDPPGMAILSACQTAMAQVTVRADEALGFPSMLLAHHVRTVVVTLWPVDDLASSLLIGQFYRFWRERKQPPARALCSAQNWLRTATAAEMSTLLRPLKQVGGAAGALASEARIRFFEMDPDSRPFSHPIYWAAFVAAGHALP